MVIPTADTDCPSFVEENAAACHSERRYHEPSAHHLKMKMLSLIPLLDKEGARGWLTCELDSIPTTP
jgi:hypothetical protein